MEMTQERFSQLTKIVAEKGLAGLKDKDREDFINQKEEDNATVKQHYAESLTYIIGSEGNGVVNVPMPKVEGSGVEIVLETADGLSVGINEYFDKELYKKHNKGVTIVIRDRQKAEIWNKSNYTDKIQAFVDYEIKTYISKITYIRREKQTPSQEIKEA